MNPEIPLPEDIALTASQAAKNTAFSPILDQINRELAASSDALAMATDAGREQFILEAKRKIEALALVDHPEALVMAGMIRQGLFEENMTQQLQVKLQALSNSLEKIYPDGNISQDKANEIAPKLYTLLRDQIEAFKTRERKLWKEVPNFELNGPFKTQEGEEIDIPNMIQILSLPTREGGLLMPNSASQEIFDKSLGEYNILLDQIKTFYGGPAPPKGLIINEFFMVDGAEGQILRAVAPYNTKLKTNRIPQLRKQMDKALNYFDGNKKVSAEDQSYGTEIRRMLLDEKTSLLKIQNILESRLSILKEDFGRKYPGPMTIEKNAKLRPQEGESGFKEFKAAEEIFKRKENALGRAVTYLEMVEVSRRGLMDPVDKGPNPLDLDTIQDFRSWLGDQIRQANSGLTANPTKAKMFRRLKDAMDLDLYTVEPMANESKTLVQKFYDAKGYTYAMNNVVKRTTLGEMRRTKGDGAGLIDPSNALKLLMSGQKIDSLKVQQIVRAAQEFDNALDPRATSTVGFPEPLRDKFEGVTVLDDFQDPATKEMYRNRKFNAAQQEEELNETVLQAIQNVNRQIVVKKLDNLGNPYFAVDEKKLNQFVNSAAGQKLISTFPTLRNDLTNVVSAQNLVDATIVNQNVLRSTPENVAFRLFMAQPESTAKTMVSILAGTSSEGVAIAPARTLQRMVDEIKKQDTYVDEVTGKSYTQQQVLDGMRSAIIGAAARRSGNFGVEFNAKKFQSYLFDPVKDVDISADFKLMDFMQKNGLVDDEYIKNVQRYLKTINTVDEAFETGDMSPILFKQGSLAKLGAIQILGALASGSALNRFKQSASQIPGLGSLGDNLVGAGVVAGNVGAKAGPRLFLTGPETLTVEAMVRIMENPKALAQALEETPTRDAMNESIQAVNDILSGALLSRQPYIRRETERQIDKSVGEDLPVTTKFPITPIPDDPTPPSVDPQPQLQGAATPPTMSPPPAAPSPAPTGPVDRSQYAALFPNDIASGLIRQQKRPEQQGIGSLV